MIRNSVSQVWQTTSSTFVTYVTANLANYIIALAEQGTASQYYAGNFPAAASGIYSVDVRLKAGVSFAETDTPVAGGSIPWTGTAVVSEAEVYARIGADGAGLTALGDTRIANLDAAVSSRGTSNFAGGAVASVTAPVALTSAYDAAKTAAQEPQGIKKNTARTITFPMVSSTDHITPVSGLTVTGSRSIDGGAFATGTLTVTESPAGSGYYAAAFLAADLNGDDVACKFTAATADPRSFTIITVT